MYSSGEEQESQHNVNIFMDKIISELEIDFVFDFDFNLTSRDCREK
jgi:hypothetical protein